MVIHRYLLVLLHAPEDVLGVDAGALAGQGAAELGEDRGCGGVERAARNFIKRRFQRLKYKIVVNSGEKHQERIVEKGHGHYGDDTSTILNFALTDYAIYIGLFAWNDP